LNRKGRKGKQLQVYNKVKNNDLALAQFSEAFLLPFNNFPSSFFAFFATFAVHSPALLR